MRAKHLFGLFAVLEALLLPCAAHAQCSDFYCETFAVYNPGSRAITGYSHYDDYGISWGWWLEVQSYVSDPTGYNNPVGQSWGYDYVEVDFCYTPTMNGGYTAWGYNYYDLEVWWVYDGDSYSPGVYVSGPPGQQITSCPSPSWVARARRSSPRKSTSGCPVRRRSCAPCAPSRSCRGCRCRPAPTTGPTCCRCSSSSTSARST